MIKKQLLRDEGSVPHAYQDSLGWKIKGDKLDELGEFGALVFTVNPLDSYGGRS